MEKQRHYIEVDLSRGGAETRRLKQVETRMFPGGRALGVHLLSTMLAPGTDPLSADNLIAFVPGALNGSGSPAGGRFSISAKSPLTNTIASSNLGGGWGTLLARKGDAALLLRGRSPEPVILVLDRDRVEFRPAQTLWGLELPELFAALADQFPPGTRSLGIGPAGENLVSFAAIAHDGGRMAGRCGLGAVLGAKNVKALVILPGGQARLPADPAAFRAGVRRADRLLRAMPITARALPELGTAGLVRLIWEHDMLPHHNFQDVRHSADEVDAICGERLREKHLLANSGCQGCRIRCGRSTSAGGRKGEGPEFETIALLGANLGIYDLEEISLANYACNDLGLDTISMGNTLGLAMELRARGLLPAEALELNSWPVFDKPGQLEHFIRLTAARREAGAWLAAGARKLAERCGHPELAMTVKGLELPGYEPRATMAQALGYATSPRGGCHLQGGYAITLGFFGGAREVDRFLISTTAGHVVDMQDSGCLADSLGICRFAFFAFGENETAALYSAFNGLSVGPSDLTAMARRVQDLEREFNLRAACGPEADTLPERFFSEEIEIAGQPRKIDRERHFKPLLQNYYQLRGWSSEGRPVRQSG